jgi:hypothetical protein
MSLQKDALRRRVVQTQHDVFADTSAFRQTLQPAPAPLAADPIEKATAKGRRPTKFYLSPLTIGAVIAIDSPWLAVTFALGIAAVAAAGIRRVWGSTLTASVAWCAVSALTVAAVETYLAVSRGETTELSRSLLRYAAVASTFCPIMAVLGSKRPQNRGWQWIVVSLWIVLLVPAGQSLAAPSGQRLELSSIWRGMLIALMAMELLNYLPTRFALLAVLATVGQALLLAPYLLSHETRELAVGSGLLLILIAGLSALLSVRRRGKKASQSCQSGPLWHLEQRWFAFRDGWGAFWGLRILQRVNQTAELSGWPVRLHWSQGFVGETSAIDEAATAHIEQTFDSLLRRFERLNQAVPQPRPS